MIALMNNSKQLVFNVFFYGSSAFDWFDKFLQSLKNALKYNFSKLLISF